LFEHVSFPSVKTGWLRWYSFWICFFLLDLTERLHYRCFTCFRYSQFLMRWSSVLPKGWPIPYILWTRHSTYQMIRTRSCWCTMLDIIGRVVWKNLSF
jgi:hypothetical protein